MHIPDGYLGPPTWGGAWAICGALWSLAATRIKKTLESKRIPLVAISAAFSFIIMMFNVPIPGGTTGHAVGGVLIALAVGPWAASLAISIALVIQALLFGDGGITAIGANCINMAFVMPFVGYWTYQILLRVVPRKKNGWNAFAAGISGWVGLNAAAFMTAVEFGVQPLIHMGPDGHALYSPYPLSVAVPVMMAEHLLLFGVVEGVVTGLVVYSLLRSKSAWMINQQTGGSSQ